MAHLPTWCMGAGAWRRPAVRCRLSEPSVPPWWWRGRCGRRPGDERRAGPTWRCPLSATRSFCGGGWFDGQPSDAAPRTALNGLGCAFVPGEGGVVTFDVESCLAATQAGRLEAWIHGYLAGGPWANAGLSAGLRLRE